MTVVEDRVRRALDSVAVAAVPERDVIPSAPRPAGRPSRRGRRVWIASGVLVAAAAAGSIVATTWLNGGTTTPATPAAGANDWQRFSADGISFEYPSAWRSYPYAFASTMSYGFTYLSTRPIPDPCSTTTVAGGIQTTCDTNPVPALAAKDVYVSWLGHGSPGLTIDNERGMPTTLAGHVARIDRSPDAEVCRGRADRAVQASIESVAQNVVIMTACLGPDPTGSNLAAVDRMLQSLSFSN